MSSFDAKLNKKERALLNTILSRTEDKRDHRGTLVEWSEFKALGFKPQQSKEQILEVTNKLKQQQVAFLVQKGRCDVELLTYPVISKCRVMNDKQGGWVIAFSVTPEVVSRKVRSVAKVEAYNKIADKFLSLPA